MINDYPIAGCKVFSGYGQQGVAIVTSKHGMSRELEREKRQQLFWQVVEVGGSQNKLPQGFDYLQATADVIHFYHHKKEVVVNEVIILADLLTPRGWDMVKLMFPYRDLSSDDQGNLVITTDESSPRLWGQHLVELLHQPTTTAPTVST